MSTNESFKKFNDENNKAKDSISNSLSCEKCEETVDLLSFNLSVVGNLKRLIAVHGKDIRFNHEQKRWLIWSGKHWEVDGMLKT